MAAYLAVLTIMIIALLAWFISTTDLKQCILCAVVMLILFESTVLMKLWYWLMHGRLSLVRDIKLLQLAVAELKRPPSPEAEGTARGIQDNGGLAPVQTPAPSSGRPLWRAILVPLWLLALANIVLWGFFQKPYEPRDMVPYFEKTGGAATATAETPWQQSFEVKEARQRFYPRLVSRGQAALVWISVAAENHEPMFSGMVGTGSMIGFGQATPGRYVVKGRTERADGDFTLRIGGVNEVPGITPPLRLFVRSFLLMLSACLIIVMPFVWLQGRWLRRVDSEL
jgi:hypothetical protein